MRSFAVLGLVALLVAVADAKGPFLGTDKNFESEVLNSGKNAFVKFLAPWWGHCKSMKPDWDKLGQAYSDHDTVLIVDVDCTAAGQGTCGKMGVQGYPTIKYFVGGDKKGKDYQGGRDFNSLKSFTEKTINKPNCNVVTKKGCKSNEVTFIEKNEAKSVAELKEELTTKANELAEVKKERKEAEKEFKEKEKELKKKELLLTKASTILKQLEKEAAKKAKTEL